MKTLKLGMLVAALMLITAGFFAGCKANIATPVSPDSFALNADEYVDSDDPFNVISITTEKYAGKDEYLVKVTFNHAVNKEGVKNGVKFYKLEDAAGQKSWEMPAMTEIESTDLKISDKTAYFTIPAKDLNLYVYVKASETKAINGIKLNEDGDEIWGEEGDDDYAYFEDLGTAPALTGNKDHNKKIQGLNNTLTFSNPSFQTGTGAEAYLVKKVEINATNFLNTYINGLNNGDLSEAAKTAKIGEATDILNKHLKLKQFNWKENKWENIDLNFIYDGTNKKWVSEVTVEKDRSLAFQWENRNDIKMTFVKYAYPLRFTLKNDASIISNNFATAESGYLSLEEGDIWPDRPLFNTLDVKKNVVREVTITLKATGVEFPFYIENGWPPAVTEDNKNPAQKSLFAGFKPETIVKENFKCTRIVSSEEKLIPISEISLVPGDPSTYPYALNKIIIKFAENAVANNVYISPNVRSASFEGSYDDGGIKKEKTIPELCFTNIKPSGNPYEWKGWLKK